MDGDAARDIERHEANVQVQTRCVMQHVLNSFRVGPPVEFAPTRFCTTYVYRSTHYEDRANGAKCFRIRIESTREIGEWANKAECQPFIRPRRANDARRGVIVLGPGFFSRNMITEPFRTVGLACGESGPRKRMSGARDNRSVNAGAPGDFSRVARCVGHLGISVHRGDCDNFERLECASERERDGIVDSGIGVDKDGGRHSGQSAALSRSRRTAELLETLASAINHRTELGIAARPQTNEGLVVPYSQACLSELFIYLRLTQMRGGYV